MKLRLVQCNQMPIRNITKILIKRVNYIKAHRNIAISEHITKTNDHSVSSQTFYSIRARYTHVSAAIWPSLGRNHTHIHKFKQKELKL